MHTEPNPFQEQTPSTNITLLSSDTTLFYVHKLILSLASPLFADMFSLPQPTPAVHPITLTENGATLAALLRLIYPISDPELGSIDTILPVLEAAIKYQLEEAVYLARRALRRMVPLHPLEVYAAACRLELEEEARLAARQWMSIMGSKEVKIEGAGRLTPWEWTTPGRCEGVEMEGVTAGAMFRLIRYARDGVDQGAFVRAPLGLKQDSEGGGEKVWYNDGDVIVRSGDGVEFKVHTLILKLASKTLLDHLSNEEIPTICLPESSPVLSHLLRMCYLTKPTPITLHLAFEILAAAQKYTMPAIAALAQQRCTETIRTNPLESYFLAPPHQQSHIAKMLFKKGTQVEITYVPEMESASAGEYLRLLKYLHECNAALLEVGSRYERPSGEFWNGDTSVWWRARNGTVGSVGLPIVQRELRRNGGVVDLCRLVRESEEMERVVGEALDRVQFSA